MNFLCDVHADAFVGLSLFFVFFLIIRAGFSRHSFGGRCVCFRGVAI